MNQEQGDMALTEKKLLSIREFSAYTSLGEISGRTLAEKAGALVRTEKKALYVDRELFDQWLDNQHREVNRK